LCGLTDGERRPGGPFTELRCSQTVIIADRTDTVSCLEQGRYRRMEIGEKRDFVSGKYIFLGTKHTVFVILIYFPVQPVGNANFRDRIVFR